MRLSKTKGEGAEHARDDEAQIFADSALRGERVVSLLRLFTWGLLGVANAGVGAVTGERPETSLVRGAVVFGWFVFAIAVAVVLRRVRFTPGRALWWPLGLMAVDFEVTLFLNLVTNRGVHPEIAGAIFLILVGFSVARFSVLHVWVSAGLATAGILTLAIVLPGFNWRGVAVMIAAYLSLAGTLHWANRQIRRMFVDVRRHDHLTRLLPHQVVQRILREGGGALQPVKREVTILFSDLRDFTTMSERMDPAALLSLLDDYYARMTRVVKAHGGMVNKFIGDGMLAVWGAPDPQPDHAQRAVAAALQMRAVLEELNRSREIPLRIGVGIHTGVVAAGMVGGAEQQEYTVLGDAVNLASRIEGLTKKVGVDVLVSQATWERCGGHFSGEALGAEAVKGRAELVRVYRVDGSASAPASRAETRPGRVVPYGPLN